MLPVPDVGSPFAAGSGTVTAILARSLAGMPSGAVTGRVKPPGGRKLSLIAWIVDMLLPAKPLVSAIRRSCSNLSKFLSLSWSLVLRSVKWNLVRKRELLQFQTKSIALQPTDRPFEIQILNMQSVRSNWNSPWAVWLIKLSPLEPPELWDSRLSDSRLKSPEKVLVLGSGPGGDDARSVLTRSWLCRPPLLSGSMSGYRLELCPPGETPFSVLESEVICLARRSNWSEEEGLWLSVSMSPGGDLAPSNSLFLILAGPELASKSSLSLSPLSGLNLE